MRLKKRLRTSTSGYIRPSVGSFLTHSNSLRYGAQIYKWVYPSVRRSVSSLFAFFALWCADPDFILSGPVAASIDRVSDHVLLPRNWAEIF